jgi:phosphoserine phosphatase
VVIAVMMGGALATACAHTQGQPATATASAPAVSAAVPPMGGWKLTGPAGGNRPLAELDVTGDGRIDVADCNAFEALAAKARAQLDAAHIDPGAAAGYYQGPLKGQASVFSLIGPDYDVASVPPARLRELYIETRWLAEQARLAAAALADEAPTAGAVGSSVTASPGGVLPAGVVGGLLAGAIPGYDAGEMPAAAVCKAAAGIDTGAYKRAGLKPTAVFDVDSTLWEGNGTDVFLAALIALKLPLPGANAGIKAFLKAYPGVDAAQVERNDVIANASLLYQNSADASIPEAERIPAKDSFYAAVGLLAGLTAEQGRGAARFAIEQGTGTLPPWKTRVLASHDGCSMMTIVQRLLNAGVDVYFLSATPDVMVEEAGVLFGIAPGHALGSQLELRDGRFTGKVRDNSYDVKGFITRQWLAAPPVVAFGDSATSDFPMLLEATGAGFMVNARSSFVRRDVEEAGARLVILRLDTTAGALGDAGGASTRSGGIPSSP